MKNNISLLILLVIIIACKNNGSPVKAPSTITALETYTDSLIHAFVDSAKVAGVSVGIFRGSNSVLHKSYGFADLEYMIPMPKDASFQIGSITKQFTAVAMLQLVDSGKIKLDDDITKYLPFNTQNHKVTIKHLLDHTSGIKGYTELPSFGALSVHNYKRDTLLKIVSKEKFDFNPGDALIYNNTGFFMLGLIIEKVSGLTYEEYVKKHLFDVAGMNHSYYGSVSKIIPNQAHGYDYDQGGLVHASYLDHVWPYSAGSLCSTVEDLVKWNQALHHGKILKEKMYSEFLKTAILNNGVKTQYAKGITVTTDHGQTMIEHGGGINGFLSENRFYPNEDLSIIVLANTTGPLSPSNIADYISDKILGLPETNKILYKGDLNKFTGTYEGRGRGEDEKLVIEKKDSILVIKSEGVDIPLSYVGNDIWSEKRNQYIFKGNELFVDQIYGYFVLKRK